jgi:hypothetical protein
MAVPARRPVTLGQYVLLSMLAFRGRGVPYRSDELTTDRRLVLGWMSANVDPEEGASVALTEVLAGTRFVGVVDGQVRTRLADEELLPPYTGQTRP